MKTLLKIFTTILVLAVVIIGGYSLIDKPYTTNITNVGAPTQKTFGGSVYYLSGSGITSTATSIGLTKLTIPQNDYAIQDSDLGSTFYMTLEPGSTSRQEFISCTTVGTNTGSTVTLSGCTRGLSAISPYTASSTQRFSHSGGSKLIFSNSPSLYNDAVFKGNDETITGTYTFTSTALPVLDTYIAPTDDKEFATKKYMDDAVIAGGTDGGFTTKGIYEQSTQIEMASTTGSVGSQKALTSIFSTSTPSGDSYSGLYLPVSENDGKLSQLWLDLTEAFTWTGNHIFNGTVDIAGLFTTTATSTMATTTMAKLTTTDDVIVGDDLTVSGTSAVGTLTSTTFTNSGTASTTDMIISGSCTGCGDDGIGTDTLASGTGDDSTVVNVGFRPSVVHYVLSAADGNESGTSHGFTDGTTTYGLSEEGGGAPVLDTLARTNTFADGRMQITIGSFTSTGFTISYDRQADTHVSEAIVRYIAVK